MNYPLWFTPQRRACLVKIALTDLSGYEIDLITGQLLNPRIEALIDWWKEENRAERSILWQREKRRMHAMPRIKRRGPFDTIRRDQYLAERPVFKVVGIGVSAFTQHRVAKVIIPEMQATLWVDISFKLEGVSKSKLRKVARYGGKIPKSIVEQIDEKVKEAVKRYLS